MEEITISNIGILLTYNDKWHSLSGPVYIFIKDFINHRAGELQYFINNKYIGTNLSNKEFERLKNIELKKMVFE